MTDDRPEITIEATVVDHTAESMVKVQSDNVFDSRLHAKRSKKERITDTGFALRRKKKNRHAERRNGEYLSDKLGGCMKDDGRSRLLAKIKKKNHHAVVLRLT